MKNFFEVNVQNYVADKSFCVTQPASLNLPKNNSVMFVTERYISQASILTQYDNCLVFWPDIFDIPDDINSKHAVLKSKNPRKEYCAFFRDNHITNYPSPEEFAVVGGAYIAKDAVIGENCRIFPGAYIGGEVVIGNDCYIGSGVRIVGRVRIGNHVIIRENAVLGADGLSTNRDEEGHALTMPQFGGIVIEDYVQIGALTVIARGAIDDTVIKKGAKIDNSTFISHNVQLGEDTFVVGETIMFGSSSTGKGALISGNATIRDGRHVGAHAIVGMGAVVVNDVRDNAVVKGNPAR